MSLKYKASIVLNTEIFKGLLLLSYVNLFLIKKLKRATLARFLLY